MRQFGKRNDPIIQEPIEYLDERFPFWLAEVLNIGQPIMDRSVKSAAIQYDKATGEFEFRMNPDFAETLTVEERAFLASHEAMHVKRNDMALHADPRYTDKAALNKAMDAIINDTLRNAGLEPPEWAVNGPRDIGVDCEDMDVDQVYEIITSQPPQSGGEGEGDTDDEPEPNEGEQSDSDDEQGDGADGEGEGESDDDAEGEDADSDGDGQSDKGDDAEDGDAQDADDGDGEGEGDESDADGEGEGDQSDGEGDPTDGDLDPTESEDEGEGGDGGEGEQDGDDADGDGDGEGGAGSQGSGEAGEMRPMEGGGHDGWDEAMAEAAEAFMDDARDDDTKGGGGGGEGQYERREGSIEQSDLDRLDFEQLFRIVEPELVDGWGMGLPPKADWRRPRRNMMGVWPQSTLPSRKSDRNKLALASKRMQLVVCLDNSGSVSPHDIALFREIARRLPTAKADYIFVVAASAAVEVSREDLLDESKHLPLVGGGASMGAAQRYANDPHVPEDMRRAAKKLTTPGFRKGAYGPHCTEMDAMNAWIEQAIESGRLRDYPKSVLAITDLHTALTSATPEQAARWTVLHNEGVRVKAGRPLSEGILPEQVDPKRRPRYMWATGCKLPLENMHRLGDLLLKSTHTRKKARV